MYVRQKRKITTLQINKSTALRVSFFIILIEAFGYGYWPRGTNLSTLSQFIDQAITLLALIIMALVSFFFSKEIIKNITKKSLIYLNIIFTLALITSFYADNVMYSLTISIRLILFYFFLLAVLGYKPTLVWESIYKFTIFFIVTNLFVVIFIPSLGVESSVRAGTWRGLIAFKTQFGLNCAFLATFIHAYSKFQFHRISKKNLTYITLLIIMCMGSQSYTALGIIFLYFLLRSIAGYYNKFDFNLKTAFTVLLIILIPVLIFSFEHFANEVFSDIGKADSMSTRFKMWGMILQGFFESPFIGYGLGRYLFLPGVLEKIQTSIWFFEISTMHNSFLEWALGAGFFAVICYFMIQIRAVQQSIKSIGTNKNGASVLLGPILVGFIGAFITSSIAFSNLYWLAPIMLAFFYKDKNNNQGNRT